MEDLPVRVERLPSMTVAAVRTFGETPEADAWGVLKEWAQTQGFLAEPDSHHIYGFNNPSPTGDEPRYGYEMWMRVDPDAALNTGEPACGAAMGIVRYISMYGRRIAAAFSAYFRSPVMP